MQDQLQLKKLRHELHQNAELSHNEIRTQSILLEFFKPYTPQSVISLCNGKALLISFESGKAGPNILFRADMDALPIDEGQGLDYSSKNPGHSHKCGHDGHMTLVASLAKAWGELSDRCGKLGLLFQHAEELGEGAKEICEDKSFLDWQATAVFGFHNIPGAKLGEVILARDIFSCASTGLRLKFQGQTIHAAEPQKARSPIQIIPSLIEFAAKLNEPKHCDDFFLITTTHFRVGQENFGITPGEGILCFTLRSRSDELLQAHLKSFTLHAQELAADAGLDFAYDLLEPFPSVIVDKEKTQLVEKSGKRSQLEVRYLDFPFLWSEDFGYFTQKYSDTYFGLGIGEGRPGLHDPNYDFNDEAIVPFSGLLKEILKVAMS